MMWGALEDLLEWGRAERAAAQARRAAAAKSTTAARIARRPQLIIPTLQRGLESMNDDPIDPRRLRPTPSKAWGLCPRKQALDQLFPDNVDEYITWQDRLVFDSGSALHEWFQQRYMPRFFTVLGNWRCRGCGLVLPSGHKIEDVRVKPEGLIGGPHLPVCSGAWKYVEPTVYWPEFNTDGKLDGILEIDWVRVVWDLKTVGRATQINAMSGPKPDNVYQLQVYLNLAEIDIGVLLYFCLEDRGKTMKEFTVVRDPSVMQDANRKMRAWHAWRGVRESGVPQRECVSRDDPMARYCQQKGPCFDPARVDRAVAKVIA